MAIATSKKQTKTTKAAPTAKRPTVKSTYYTTADDKKRISLRGAKVKHFQVMALSNGSYLLEPRVLVPPEAVSARTLKMLDQAAANFKAGVASDPIDLSAFAD